MTWRQRDMGWHPHFKYFAHSAALFSLNGCIRTMTHPIQPPTRPHSANPLTLNPSLSIFPRPSSRPTIPRGASMSSFGLVTKDAEDWEDAWDSSSDKEDGGEPSGMPMSMPGGGRKSRDDGEGIAASWASTSYTHVTYPNSSPTRPALPQSKTFTEGVAPPAPGTSAINGALRSHGHGHAGGSRLPPGGAWEIVEPEEIIEEEQEPIKTGKEAVRVDVENILRDPLELLHSLSLDSPAISRASSRSSSFPFFASNDPLSSAPASPSYTPTTPTAATNMKSRKDGMSRQRSVRSERRREKFAKVLRGDEGGVDVGELRRLAWSGVPMEVRPIVWQLLLVRFFSLQGVTRIDLELELPTLTSPASTDNIESQEKRVYSTGGSVFWTWALFS